MSTVGLRILPMSGDAYFLGDEREQHARVGMDVSAPSENYVSLGEGNDSFTVNQGDIPLRDLFQDESGNLHVSYPNDNHLHIRPDTDEVNLGDLKLQYNKERGEWMKHPDAESPGKAGASEPVPHKEAPQSKVNHFREDLAPFLRR